MNSVLRCAIVLLLLIHSTTAFAQEPAATSQPAADTSVVATVNGQTITEGEVDAMLMGFLEKQMQGRPVGPQIVEQAKKQLRPQIIEGLIDLRLLDMEVTRSSVSVSEEDLQQIASDSINGYLIRSGQSKDEFTEQLQQYQNMTFQEFIVAQSKDDDFRRSVRHMKMYQKLFPEKSKVTDEEVKERYQSDLAEVYTKPELVRASHILFKAGPNDEQTKRQAAMSKAESLLVEARKPEADFAELARQHSEGPSAPSGGDLGFFPRHGMMVEPFAEAAFALPQGDVSQPVETRFGYHLIKVTDRKPQSVVSLEQASGVIRDQLLMEKSSTGLAEHVTALRKTATIVYAEPTPAATTQPANRGNG